VLICDKRR